MLGYVVAALTACLMIRVLVYLSRQAAKAKREAEMREKGGGKMEWIELDMTGKPLEEVIEYEVRPFLLHTHPSIRSPSLTDPNTTKHMA